MKPKSIMFLTIVTILSFVFINNIVTFGIYSSSLEFVALFFVMLVLFMIASSRIRKFFILPDNLFIRVLIRSTLIALALVLGEYVTGGFNIKEIVINSSQYGSIEVIKTVLPFSATIAIGSVLTGLLIEILLTLSKE